MTDTIQKIVQRDSVVAVIKPLRLRANSCAIEVAMIMPPNSKKLEGHFASGLFVHPSFRPSIRHAF